MCIHPSLHCDGHPQCPQAEDEDNCYDDYVRKKIVKPYATYKCRSVLYEGKVSLVETFQITLKFQRYERSFNIFSIQRLDVFEFSFFTF